MNARLLLWLTVIVGATMTFAELVVGPANGAERLQLLAILAAPAVAAAALVPLLRRWVSNRSSVAGTALLVGLSSLASGAVTTSAASNAMFLSSHDFRLFLVVLVLSSGIALAVGWQLTRPLADDIARVGRVADQVAGGDLTARTGVRRNDEVGLTARAVDSMVASLGRAAEERQRTARARQLLFSSIGHDLRTPLAAMRAAVESLQDGVAPDPQRYYGVLGAQLDNVEGLLDQLVEYARIESGHAPSGRGSVSIAELADEAVEALSPVAHRAGVSLGVTTDGPALATASVVEISRVLRNLVDNAIRHSPTAGAVEIEVRTMASDVVVAVADDGPGFPDGFGELAFEPFTRADPARDARAGHAGLGLAIARALVEAHGGRIWIASSDTSGPVDSSDTPAATLADTSGPGPCDTAATTSGLSGRSATAHTRAILPGGPASSCGGAIVRFSLPRKESP